MPVQEIKCRNKFNRSIIVGVVNLMEEKMYILYLKKQKNSHRRRILDVIFSSTLQLDDFAQQLLKLYNLPFKVKAEQVRTM